MNWWDLQALYFYFPRMADWLNSFGAAADDRLCADGIAVYKDIPFMTELGPVTSTIPNAHVA